MADPNALERWPRNGRLLPGKPCFRQRHNAPGSPQLTDDLERKLCLYLHISNVREMSKKSWKVSTEIIGNRK